MKIYKTQFVLTVLSEEPIPEDMDLEQILQESYDGRFISAITDQPETILTDPETIRSELESLNNDGTFFDDPDREVY